MPITPISHKLITPANNHGIIQAQLGPYVDVTARRLQVLTSAHKGLVAEQLSDHSLWVVVYNGSGYSWGPLCAGPEALFSGDFGAIFEATAGAGTTLGSYWADRGLHKTGSIVNSIDNQITTGSPWGNLVEVSAGVGIGTAGAGVNGHADVIANGTTQSGKIVMVPSNLVAPATTPLHVWALMMSTDASPGANRMFFGVSFNFSAIQLPGGVVFEDYNGAALATALVANSYGRLRSSFTGSTADEIKWGSTAAVTSTNSGNNPTGGGAPMGVFGDGVGGTLFAGKMLGIVYSKATKANFLAACTAAEAQLAGYYGGGAPLI